MWGMRTGIVGLDVLVQCFQPSELRREAAFTCRVDDEDDFAFEVF